MRSNFAAITRLIVLFAPRVKDRSTLDELLGMSSDFRTWHEGHTLFDRIREKTLIADSRKDDIASCQYLFEESCAKTLYNLSGPDDAFDADSPYWIVPNALSLARRLGIPDSDVAKIVAG
jgi:hypothetical protein